MAANINTYPGLATRTIQFAEDVRWIPFVAEDGRVGYQVTRLSDGAVTFIYLNPSSEGDGGGKADVFLYSGPHNDPANDMPHHYYTPEFEENPR